MSDDEIHGFDWGGQELNPEQIKKVIQTQRTLRVGFAADGKVYVVVMGYAWFDDALNGITSAGRKLDMALASPKVAFSIDTSGQTGPWNWHSVAGEGLFEVIRLPRAALQLTKFMAQPNRAKTPTWFKVSTAKEVAAGNLVCWRIKPSLLTGRWLGSAEIDAPEPH